MKRVYVESPDRLRLFLEPGPVVVTSADSLRTAHVAGGPLTNDYQRFDAVTKPLGRRFKTVHSQAEFDAVNKEYCQAGLAFVKAHPASWVGLDALQQARQIGPPQYIAR